ncbi:MAG: hypothetical protein KGV56_01290 [Gammaproteobacteria bacterium]|nr:hypothetical protein [Gammaproteobacteria bacterium]
MNKKLIKLALCHTIPNDHTTEMWLPLIPAQGDFSGRDGRKWAVTNAQAVIDETELPFLLDVEHASETSDDTSASGWFTELKIEDGQVLGKLELNQKGKQLIDDKTYKFYSPAYYADKHTGEVIAFSSVGLTNKPNLAVPALNKDSAQDNLHNHSNGENTMKELMLALGLNAEASEQAALNAVQQLKTKAEKPDLNAFVPKATHDQVVTELNTAKKKLAEIEKGNHDKEVEIAINSAIADKKIAPADKEFYMNACATEKGLEDFRQFVSNKAPIIGDADIGNTPPKGGETALNKEQKSLLSQLGLSEKDINNNKEV